MFCSTKLLVLTLSAKLNKNLKYPSEGLKCEEFYFNCIITSLKFVVSAQQIELIFNPENKTGILEQKGSHRSQGAVF